MSAWAGDVRMIKIASHSPPHSLAHVQSLFPQLQLVAAVDARASDAAAAAQAGDLSLAAYRSIRFGRTQHAQLPTMGALGLFLSWRTALLGDGPLLLLEEDCVCSAHLRQVLDEFEAMDLDVGMIGTIAFGGQPAARPDWVVNPTMAFQTHCVVFSPSGRTTVREYVTTHAADLQVDMLLVTLSQIGAIRLGVCHARVAAQVARVSTIQTSAQRIPPDAMMAMPAQAGSSWTTPICAIAILCIVVAATGWLLCAKAAVHAPSRRDAIDG